jgi:hypothetical protein
MRGTTTTTMITRSNIELCRLAEPHLNHLNQSANRLIVPSTALRVQVRSFPECLLEGLEPVNLLLSLLRSWYGSLQRGQELSTINKN